jgi:hypothetical protein
MTSCTPTAEVKIGPIDYIDGGDLKKSGELIVAVESSGYNLSSLRDALIDSIAANAQQGATGKNCYNATYFVEPLSDKRDLGFLGWSISRFFKRADRPAPISETKSIRMCSTNWFAAANYYNIFWHTDDVTSPSAWINADYKFQAAIPGGDFLCELIDDLIDAFALIEPEFAVEDIELEEAIGFLCGDKPDE